MKYVFLLLLLMGFVCDLQAQEQTVQVMQENARTLMQGGDFDNAIILFEKAKQKEPNNIEIQKDLCYTNFLKRDFSRAIEVGKEMVENPNADPQAFQILGLAYKEIASYKEAGVLYRKALKKFPNSGVIYNEYAEIYALDKEIDEAIVQWEKGIEVDPGYSSNYYNATLYHIRKGDWLRAAIYGEFFLNLESYSTRTEEIKPQVLIAYKSLLIPGTLQQLKDSKTASIFEKTLIDVLSKASAKTKMVGMDDLLSIRTRFIIEWISSKQKQFPYRLFEQQQYLLSQGLFEAYQYWLFQPSIPVDTYDAWLKKHNKEMEGFKAFQGSRVFKVPVGQYYFNR